jgi:hypothetical protein
MPLLLLLALLLRPAAAADVSVRLYEPASPHWTTPMQTPLAALAGSGTPLAVIGELPSEQRAAALAPVVFELQHSLQLTPEAFAKLEPSEQTAALSLAADQARDTIVQKSYELVGEAKGVVWSNEAMDRDGLIKLHSLAAQLQEVNRHYATFLGHDEREAVAATSAQASSRYLEARAAYLGHFAQATADALGQGGQRAPPGETVAVSRTNSPAFEPSAKARKLLERMKETKSGWGEKDIETVYVGYGFTYRDGSKHRIYSHPLFKQLRTTVSRQTSLPPGYAVDAVKLITEAMELGAPTALPALAAAAEDTDLPPVPTAVSKPVVVKTAEKPVTRVAAAPAELAPLTPIAPVAVADEPTEKIVTAKPAPAVESQPAAESSPAPQAANAWDRFRARFKRLFGS